MKSKINDKNSLLPRLNKSNRQKLKSRNKIQKKKQFYPVNHLFNVQRLILRF